MNEAKEVHSMLRRAAGIFTFVQTEFLPQLDNPPPLGSDLDPRVLNAYVNQCTAEAQEGCTRARMWFQQVYLTMLTFFLHFFL